MKMNKKKFNKKLMIPLFAVLLIGSVFAVGYLVNSLTLNVGVAEPFTVEYAVLGDGAGSYVGETCENTGRWFTSTTGNIPKGNMYAGESRYVCVKIKNLAEAVIPYTISNTVRDVDGNWNQGCVDVFGERTGTNALTGNANPITIESGITMRGVEIVANANATPTTVNGCNVKIEVARGA